MLRYLTAPALVAALLVTTPATAQTNRAAPPAPIQSTNSAAPRAAAGTFQIVQRPGSKRQVSLTTESLAEIERRRQASVETRWELNEYAYVLIPSRSVISAPGFRALAPIVSGQTR